MRESSIASVRDQTRLPDSLPAALVPGLYVHVPFCFHKCHYCDFYSITRQTPERMQHFVDRVLSEAASWAQAKRGPEIRPRTVFFGGGTPSLLPLESMQRLLRGLRGLFDFSELAEWTVECNPATVSPEYCGMLCDEGVDRLSFGAQSFARAELRLLERHHDPDDVPRSLELARAAGFARLNVDLIYAIPGQALDSWAHSLEAAVKLGTDHLSAYNLTYEPNTPIAVKKRLGLLQPIEEDLELRCLHHARAYLRDQGYHAYEISNYARPGQECRHNLLYWTGGNYVGLGPSAASHVEGWRWKNLPHLGEWERAIDSGALPAAEVEHLSPAQRAGELIMLQLRLKDGVRFEDFARQTGIEPRERYGAVLDRLAGAGLIQRDSEGFRLSETGINVADAVAAEFLVV